MKDFFIKLITLYQLSISPLLPFLFGVRYICRYELSCSEYTKQAILKKGVIIGLYLGLKRIISCQPFSKKTYGKSL